MFNSLQTPFDAFGFVNNRINREQIDGVADENDARVYNFQDEYEFVLASEIVECDRLCVVSEVIVSPESEISKLLAGFGLRLKGNIILDEESKRYI